MTPQARPAVSERAPDGCPKYLRLAKSFEHQLRAGVLKIGDRLPSIRLLREAHGVSAATAVGCYLWLERQGYIRAQPRSGYFVSAIPVCGEGAPDVASRVRGPVPVRVASIAAAGVAPPKVDAVDLGPAVIAPALLPSRRLNRSMRLALAAFDEHAVRYEDVRGNLRLRRQIARLIFRQGAACGPDDVLVTSGSTEALNLALRAVAAPGDVIAIESPSCYETLQLLESLHLRAIEVPHVPHEGIDLRLLEGVAERHRIAAVITVATCHNPFGDCASDASKARLVAFATSRGIPIVEGDTFGDLVFTSPRPRALKAFDTAGIVLQCCSLAHYLAPGFNLGWIAPGRWRREVERLKSLTTTANACLPQLAMAEFLESGCFETHLRELRLTVWRSIEVARDQILRSFPPGTRVSLPEGGWVLWVQLPDGYDGVEIAARAAEHGITILPGTAFSASGQYRSCIRLACGHPQEVLRSAIRRLARIIASSSERLAVAR